jgi:hypothetical protein
MSKFGVVSIVVGVDLVCSRGPLLVAPTATLRCFKGVIATNGRIRVLGIAVLILGTVMAVAGASEHGGLALLLSVVGWALVGTSTMVLLLFPAAYRSIAEAVLPSDKDEDLPGWRLLGLLGVVLGGLLIYSGVLAL